MIMLNNTLVGTPFLTDLILFFEEFTSFFV